MSRRTQSWLAVSAFALAFTVGPTGGPVHSAPVIGADGTIYVAFDDGYLYTLGP